MRRNAGTKLARLEARHPGLNEKVQTMFAECWPLRDVKHVLESQYGEHLSLRVLQKYRSRHWQELRECARATSAAVEAARHPAIVALIDPAIEQLEELDLSSDRVIERLERALDALRDGAAPPDSVDSSWAQRSIGAPRAGILPAQAGAIRQLAAKAASA